MVKIEKYYEWMFSKIEPFFGKRVLDIGSNRGSTFSFFLDSVDLLVATDISRKSLDFLKDRFRGNEKFQALYLDISSPDIDGLKKYNFDTIVCINVLEHIENDADALKNMGKIASTIGGKIILIVPALSALYNQMDKNVGHYRCYDKHKLANMANSMGLDVVFNCYFNMLGVPVYYLKGKLLGVKKAKKKSNGSKNKDGSIIGSMSESTSKLYNIASCVLKPVERFIAVPIGLSEIIVIENRSL